ncbi:hypothetical protein RJ641_028746 [Dillenia turbinata]|uniref:Uncharacterized protein n=1 Tax=Dillenia turbinata TaxID=194707 RepID=A0AAN8VS74_9MAGN
MTDPSRLPDLFAK